MFLKTLFILTSVLFCECFKINELNSASNNYARTVHGDIKIFLIKPDSAGQSSILSSIFSTSHVRGFEWNFIIYINRKAPFLKAGEGGICGCDCLKRGIKIKSI